MKPFIDRFFGTGSSPRVRGGDAIARCRTLARISLDVEQRDPIITPVSQVIASEAAELRACGETFSAIARHFGVTPNTVKKALRWFRQR